MPAIFDEHPYHNDGAGKPLVGGKVYIGVAGSDPVTIPKTIYSNRALTLPTANPQLIDANGQTENKLWVDGEYSIRVDDFEDNQIYQELDNGSPSAGVVDFLINVLGANDIVATSSLGISSYADKQSFSFTVAQINTDAVTLNINSVGVKSVVKNFGKPILPSDFAANQIVTVTYNAITDVFEWNNQKLTTVTFYEGDSVASANSTDIWSNADGNTIHVTGNTNINSFATAPNVGAKRTLIFDSSLTLNHSVNLNLPNEVNFTTAPGDVVEVYADTLTQFDVSSSSESIVTALPNLNSIQNRTIILDDAGADAFWGWDDSSSSYQNLMALEVQAIIQPIITALPNLISIQNEILTLSDEGTDALFGWDDSVNSYRNLSTPSVAAIIEPIIGSLPNLNSIQNETVQFIDPGINAFFGWDVASSRYENLITSDVQEIIEPIIDTLPILTSIQNETVTLADAGTDAFWGWDDSSSSYQNLTATEAVDILPTATQSSEGVVEFATIGEFRDNTSNVRALESNVYWDAHDEQTLAFSPSLFINFDLGINFDITLTGDITLFVSSATNATQKRGYIRIVQDGIGGHALDWSLSDWFFPGGLDPGINTTANAESIYLYEAIDDNKIILYDFHLDIKEA